MLSDSEMCLIHIRDILLQIFSFQINERLSEHNHKKQVSIFRPLLHVISTYMGLQELKLDYRSSPRPIYALFVSKHDVYFSTFDLIANFHVL